MYVFRDFLILVSNTWQFICQALCKIPNILPGHLH